MNRKGVVEAIEVEAREKIKRKSINQRRIRKDREIDQRKTERIELSKIIFYFIQSIEMFYQVTR